MDSLLISVIVPVYQVEEYLDECVQSLLAQTYDHLEILLIDDGSRDGCPRMCDGYAERDPRVRAVHQENRGLSGARNTGLRLAEGEYIAFVDADDLVSPFYIEYLYRLIRTYGAQMAACGYGRSRAELKAAEEARGDGRRAPRCWERMRGNGVRPSAGRAQPERRGKDSICLTSDRMLREWHGERKRLETVVWNKLYHRSLLTGREGGGVFPEGRIHEDVYVSHLLAAEAERIAVTRQKLYLYRRRGESLTSRRLTPERAVCNLKAQSERLKYFVERGYRPAGRRLAAGMFLHWLLFEWKLRGRAVDRKRELLKYLIGVMI